VGQHGCRPDERTRCPTVTVEVWSDVVCPWCYIGKRASPPDSSRSTELAAEGIDVAFDVSYHPTSSTPPRARRRRPGVDAYAKKFGGPERAGDHRQRDRHRRRGRPRVPHGPGAAGQHAARPPADLAGPGSPTPPSTRTSMKERLLQAYFTDGLNIGDPDVLADCAAEVGFDRDEVAAFLASDAAPPRSRRTRSSPTTTASPPCRPTSSTAVGHPGRSGTRDVRPGAAQDGRPGPAERA
jgi:hypothetical protein